MSESRQEHRLRVVLRVLAGVFLLAALGYAIGPLVPDSAGFVGLMPFASNSAVKVSVLAALCLYAAGDLRRRRGLVVILIVAHLVSVVAMALIGVVTDIRYDVSLPVVGSVPLPRLLLVLMGLDGVIAAVLAILYWRVRQSFAKDARRAAPPPLAWRPPSEQALLGVLRVLVVLFAVSMVGYELGPRFAPDFFREIPFVTNSVVKVSTLGMLCGYILAGPERRLSLVGPLISVHLLSVVVQLVYLGLGDAGVLNRVYRLPAPLGESSMRQILVGAVGLDGVMAVVLAALYFSAWRSRLGASFLRPMEFRTLESLAEVMVGSATPAITPREMALNADARLGNLRTRRKVMFRLALSALHYAPLVALHPPLPELSRSLRIKFIKQRFYRAAGQPKWRWFRAVLQIGARLGHQLTALGYYNDRRTHPTIGFVRFTERPGVDPDQIPRPPLQLQVLRPWDVHDRVIETDVCVIGTGAGGATAAYALAEGDPSLRVLLVERGCYVEPRHFSEDELHQVGALYDRGMLQVAEDFRFNVLQGNCVGGSTTVNNAICFDPPEATLLAWNRAGADLSIPELRAACQWLRQFMRVDSLKGVLHHKAATVLQPAVAHHGARLGIAAPEAFDANIKVGPGDGCFGCGYCNIGCGWGRKLSMLDHTLPEGQRRFGTDRFRILAECEAIRLRSVSGRPRARVAELDAELSDGRRIAIRARTFVVACGAIGSSHLLLRSGIGGRFDPRPVGRGLGFNMLTPVFAEFDRTVNSFEGIQMGHYLTSASNRYIIETWFSPPVGLATAMPGWFGDHYANMRGAGRMVAYGMVVGTEATGRAFQGLTGPGFKFTPTTKDLARLGEGLKVLGELLFAAGARRVLLNTWSQGVLSSPKDLGQIARYVTDPAFITLASSHPQGGNAVNRNPRRGVVGPDFRVHGYDNLYVADASVFPGSVQVNPQLTVMTLARYAAWQILSTH